MATALPVESSVMADPAMTAFTGILDPRALAVQVGEFLPASDGGLEVLHVQVLRYHPGKRCVFEVTLRTQGRSLGLIGKLYAKDRSHVYRMMEALQQAGFSPSERFSIPQPLAYLQPLRLLWQEKVEGNPATEWLLSGDESDRAAAAERCAAWLAAFHDVALREGERFDADGYLLAMEQWVLRVVAAGEPLADKAAALFEQLQAAASEMAAAELCTIHGDYSHHQVILCSDGRTVTIDWDKYRLADPVQDVARFAVGLQRLAGRRFGSVRALDSAVGVFLETYLGPAPSGLAARIPFHRAAICLEHAKHDVHKQADGWRDRAAATLDEGLRVLAEGS